MSSVAWGAAGNPLPRCSADAQSFYLMRYMESTAPNTVPKTILELATAPATGAVTRTLIWDGATAPVPSQWDASLNAGATVAAGMGKDGYVYALRAVGLAEVWSKPGTWGPPDQNWRTHTRRYEMLRYGRAGVDNLGIVSGLGTYVNDAGTTVSGATDRRLDPNFNAADIDPVTGIMYVAAFATGGSLNAVYKIDVTQSPPQYVGTLTLNVGGTPTNIPGAQSGDFAIDAAGQYAYGVAKAPGFLGNSTSYRFNLNTGAVETLATNLGIIPYGGAARLPNNANRMAFYGLGTQIMSLPGGTLGSNQTTASADSADAAACLPKLKATLQCTPTELVDSADNVATCTVTLDQPAPVGGMAVALIAPPANSRYTTTCGPSVSVDAGETSALCTITATPNTVPGDGDVTADIALATPGATDDYELGTPDRSSVLVKNDDALTASLACTPTELFDSPDNVSTCTITLNGPAPSGGLTVALTPPASNSRYTSTCASSAQIAAGATQAQCTITAVPNTVPGDGDVQATLTLVAGDGYSLGAPSSALVNVKNDDNPVPSAKGIEPVPSLGEWALFVLSLGMIGLAGRRHLRR